MCKKIIFSNTPCKHLAAWKNRFPIRRLHWAFFAQNQRWEIIDTKRTYNKKYDTKVLVNVSFEDFLRYYGIKLIKGATNENTE